MSTEKLNAEMYREIEEHSKETYMCGEPVQGGHHDNHYPISQFDYVHEVRFGSLLTTEDDDE